MFLVVFVSMFACLSVHLSDFLTVINGFHDTFPRGVSRAKEQSIKACDDSESDLILIQDPDYDPDPTDLHNKGVSCAKEQSIYFGRGLQNYM